VSLHRQKKKINWLFYLPVFVLCVAGCRIEPRPVYEPVNGDITKQSVPAAVKETTAVEVIQTSAESGAIAEVLDVNAVGEIPLPQQIEQPAEKATEKVATAEQVDIASVAAQIYKGNFIAAAELLNKADTGDEAALGKLEKIIEEYNAIEQRRKAALKTAYEERLAQLNEFSVKYDTNAVDANDVVKTMTGAIRTNLEKFIIKDGTNTVEVNDVVESVSAAIKTKLQRFTIKNDTNNVDVNDVVKVLLAVIETAAYADEQQKEHLLERKITTWAVEKTLQKSAEYQAQGKWLDALFLYRRLQNLYKDNKEYEDCADKLTQKVLIKASLQDSTCETWQQRHKNIDKEIFIWAIKVLDFRYISLIDYREMASKAIERCKLLTEVVSFADSWKTDFPRPDSNMVAVFCDELDEILNDVRTSFSGGSRDKFISVFEQVLTLNTKTINLPQEVLIAQFSQAAIASLDPYTTIVWPVQVEEFSKNITNEFTGIGIEITKADGPLTVASLLPGTPAYNSGLDAGDIIEAVDGLPTKDMPIGCAVQKITGPAGTKVRLTVRHQGLDKTEDITITRARIIVPTIRGWRRDQQGQWQYIIDEQYRIGYVRITDFSPTTADDFEDVLKQLEAKSLQGLIVDLRFNSGGLLESAVAIADKFLSSGRIVSTRPRFASFRTYLDAHKKGTHPDYPLVILINSNSASASEIVAGALQDPTHKRAILLGQRTFGKGSVQTIVRHPASRAQLKFTMGYYHLPSGQRVESRDVMKKLEREDWGVAPDIEVELKANELKKMIDVQRDNDVLARVGPENDATHKRHPIVETLEADPQLAVALLIVKTKLIEAEADTLSRSRF